MGIKKSKSLSHTTAFNFKSSLNNVDPNIQTVPDLPLQIQRTKHTNDVVFGTCHSVGPQRNVTVKSGFRHKP